MRIVTALMLLTTCLGAASPLHAQTLVGTWQATAGNDRRVLKVTKTPRGTLHGEIYNLGQEFAGNTLNGNPVSSILLQGREVHFNLDDSPGAFDGSLATDGKSIVGNWTVGGQRFPRVFERATEKTAWVIDPSPHKVRFVTVEPGVRLEVLDWGGEGPPLVFLAGAGDTAHVFDTFALKFTSKHHVYGITRRGSGLSSKPEPNDRNYDADRLGDDVLAVIDALKLDRPVIAGHSLGGEEMSSIGTRHPERVSGLIYLDASYAYAFYSSTPSFEAIYPDASTMRRDLLQMFDATVPQREALIQDMQATMPRLQADLQRFSDLETSSFGPPRPGEHTLGDRIEQYKSTSMRRYSNIKGPVLAIVAVPHACAGAICDSPVMKDIAAGDAAQTDAFQAGVPQARVVRIPQAQHYVFLSNEAEVIREMNAFMDGLH